MKYLTKDWLIKLRLSYLDKIVRCSKIAEMFNEKYYCSIYKSRFKKFSDNEKSSLDVGVSKSELAHCEEWINEGGISDIENERRKKYKELLLFLPKDDSGIDEYKYNEEFTRKVFDATIRSRIELISHLPESILCEVADIRVFALGCVSRKVKILLQTYCKNLRRECDKILKRAQIETNLAEDKLPKLIMANEYEELLLRKINQRDGNVFIVFDAGTLKITGGEIVEREQKQIYHYNQQDPYPRWSMVTKAEISYENSSFILHLLIDNKNKKGESKYWYLTVKGTNILECKDSKLSYVPYWYNSVLNK